MSTQAEESVEPEDPNVIDFTNNARERETVITQDVPIRVLSTDTVEGIHEPRTREPDVHIELPPLIQLKTVSDRFTKLALAAKSNASSLSGLTSIGPKLEMSANMHGCLRVRITTDAMKITSTWTKLTNPQLDPAQMEEGALQNHPSERMRQLGDPEGQSEEGWAKVKIDGRDWSKVMSVGRVGGRVIACMQWFTLSELFANLLGFCDDHALILYVYLNSEDNQTSESVLTVSDPDSLTAGTDFSSIILARIPNWCLITGTETGIWESFGLHSCFEIIAFVCSQCPCSKFVLQFIHATNHTMAAAQIALSSRCMSIATVAGLDLLGLSLSCETSLRSVISKSFTKAVPFEK